MLHKGQHSMRGISSSLCLVSPAMYTSGLHREARLPALVCGRVTNRKPAHLCIAVFQMKKVLFS